MITLFILLMYLISIKTDDISGIISKFEEEKCIEGSSIDSELFTHASELSKSTASSIASKNSLSLIHQLAQLNKIEYYYYLEKDEGPAHQKYFYVSLTLGNEVYKGNGMNLKEAKRHAAEEALLNTKYIIPQQKQNHDNAKLTPTVELNNVATKFGMKVTYLSEDELIAESLIYKQKNFTIPDQKSFKSHLNKLNHSIYHPYETKTLDVPQKNQKGRQFRAGVIVGVMKFIGTGLTQQSAKHDAAHHALVALRKLTIDDIEECISDGVICNPDNNQSPISVLYEMAQANKIHLDFEVVGETGPVHEKVFVTKCQFGDLTVEGSGKSKKLSKRSASENMLEKLKQETPADFDSVVSAAQMSKKKQKKRKKMLIKNKFEKFAIDAKNFVSSTWDYVFPEEKYGDDNGDSFRSKKSGYGANDKTNDFKQILLNLAQERGISTNLVDLGVQNSKYFTLAFLDLEPKHVCLGEAQSYDLSQQMASLEALNFLYKLGITSLIPSQEAFENIKNMDFGQMYIIGSDTVVDDEDVKKK